MSFIKENGEVRQNDATEILDSMECMLERRLPLNKDEVLLVELKHIAKSHGYIHSNCVVPQ